MSRKENLAMWQPTALSAVSQAKDNLEAALKDLAAKCPTLSERR